VTLLTLLLNPDAVRSRDFVVSFDDATLTASETKDKEAYRTGHDPPAASARSPPGAEMLTPPTGM